MLIYIIVGTCDHTCIIECMRKMMFCMHTGDLIPGSAGHTLLSSSSSNLFDI